MEITDLLNSLLRWGHIVAGILWIGLLWWFNWVNGPLQGKLDAATKKALNPEMLPRALFFFRWGAAWTWTFGVLMLWLVFWSGSLMFDAGGPGWTGAAIAMVIVVFIAPFIYDMLAKSALAKNPKVFAAIGFVLIVVAICGFMQVAGFSYRAYVIHTGAMLGSIMAFNVWFRIWPGQKKVIAAVKSGTPPDAALVAAVGARSKHNTYLSVPLVWMMINAHTAAPAASWPWFLPLCVLIGWALVWWMYKKAAKVQGF